MMRLRVFFTSLSCVAGLAACAPDSIQSYKAGGLNDFLDTVQAQCQPLWIGRALLPDMTRCTQSGWISLPACTTSAFRPPTIAKR